MNESTSKPPSTFLILGATGGIGASLSRRLAEAGSNVVLAGRDRARLARLATETGGTTAPLDATSFDSVDAAFDAAVASHGRLDGVANCVGSLLLKPAHITSEQDWRSVIDVNLTSAFATVRAAGKRLARQGGASIVLVSTAAVRIGLPNHEAIAAAKGGLEGLVRSAAATYARGGVLDPGNSWVTGQVLGVDGGLGAVRAS